MKFLSLLPLLLGCASHHLTAILPGATPLLPLDEAPHNEAQTEWWHVHGSLHDSQTGEPLDFFVAFLVERTDLDRVGPIPVSLAVNPMHAAYGRIDVGDKTWTADRYSFPDLFAARFVGDSNSLDLRHGGWRIAWEENCLVLRFSVGPNRLDLRIVPQGVPVLPGDYGRVEIPPGSSHLWVQQEAMTVEGSWKQGGHTRWLDGTAFYKHQWGRLYDPGLDGFEWISMDLDADLSLSIGWLSDDGMWGVPGSLAFITDRSGNLAPIPVGQLRVTPTRTWHSRRSGAHWPVAWKVEADQLDLTVETRRDDQEIWSFPAPMHVGPARARGSFMGQEVDVDAFVEQTGAKVPALRFLFQSKAPR